MDAYIYAADIYCEDCGRSIRERLDREGSAPSDPDDEASYDSDQYPKGPFDDGGGEADCPQHCGSHGDCLNAIELKDGRKVGAFLENPLTSQGDHYVQESHRDDPSELTAMWMEHYSLEPLPDPRTPARSRLVDDEGQPSWELVANLGDRDPITYGGFFVYRDRTGQYPPEADVLESVDDSIDVRDPKARWIVHTIQLEPCTFVNGILSDNRFHPESSAWFADDVGSIQGQFDPGDVDIIADLCSDDPERLAFAYGEIGRYHGFINFDEYPQTLTLAEVKARYPEFSR